MDNIFKTTSNDYGQDYLVDSALTLKELGDNELKIRYLQKSLKSKRRLEQNNLNTNINSNPIEDDINSKYKYDKNAIISKKFPFRPEESSFPYPENKPKSLYVKSSEIYGSKKPNELELPEKYHPINTNFSKQFPGMYKNNSLNTAPSKSKVHHALDEFY